MRISRGNVESVFKLFVEAMGSKIATGYNDVGSYRLDYNSVYGGYNVERIENVHGGVSNPFGDVRRSVSEMYYTLCFTLRVVESMKQEAK